MTNPNIKSPEVASRVDELMLLSSVVYAFMDTKRATRRHDRFETDGEHTLHLQFLAVNYASRFYPDLDIAKVSLYCLVHDFVEVYADDVNSLIATPEELSQKALAEHVALRRLETELGDAWPHLIGAIQAYETLIDKEARFVKCFDKCDPSFSHVVDGGSALRKMGVTTREVFEQQYRQASARLQDYTAEFPDVMALRDELFERVADTTFDAVY